MEDDVEKSFQDSDLTAKHEAEGHGRVDVAAGDVADRLRDGGDRHAESERDANDVSGVTSHAVDKIRYYCLFVVMVVEFGSNAE